MDDPEFLIWLLFLLMFAILPIKSFFIHLYEVLNKISQFDTTPRTKEEDYQERHYSQLYRPGDKKYDRIVELSDRAKSVN